MKDIDRKLLDGAKRGNIEEVKKCLEQGSNVNVEENDGTRYTPLNYAAKSGSEECCRILLDYKASVNAAAYSGRTSLHYAAEAGSEGCCKILLDNKASVNAMDEDGWTPLYYAATSGSGGCCKILLDNQASVNALVKTGDSLLHFVCYQYNEDGDMKYYKIIRILVNAGAKTSLKNQEGTTAFDELSGFRREQVQKEDENITLIRKLMVQGTRPVDVLKVFLVGNASDGKTSIKNTLTRDLSVLSKIKSMFSASSKKDDDEEATVDYTKTPGIDVGKETVKGVGQFVFWDCAGQVEYAITHGMFLGSRQSLFVVMYDLEKISKGETPSTKYWLPFIKAIGGRDDKPEVILVGSHLDKIKDRRNGRRVAEELLRQTQNIFADTLHINDELIILDARKEKSEGLERLKNALKTQRDEIIGNERIPKLCDKIEKMAKPWREEEVPVISWGQFFERVKEKYVEIDEENLRHVTKYLHMMGVVYLAEFAEKEDQVVLNTQWFTSEIIGAAFAGEEFAAQFQTLPNQPYYTLQQLRDFFTKKMDTTQLLALLIHMDLVHETNDKTYLMPGKLPDRPEVDWDTREVYDVKGRSIECVEESDIFNPSVFPYVQKKILDECKARGSTTDVSRSAVKFEIESIQILVQLTQYKRSINIAAICPNKDSVEACYISLQYVVDLIQQELVERSPGTNLRKTYISHDSLREGRNLGNAITYTKESLFEAEKRGGNVALKGTPEEVTKILFQGYDKMFLQELGLECRYEWLPIETVTRCFGRLDTVHKWEEDYRAVGKALGFQEHTVVQLAEECKANKESVTDNIIKKWCKEKKTKMTIGMLEKLLGRLSLVANEDALKAIHEVMEKYQHEYRRKDVEKDGKDEKNDLTFKIGVSEDLARWRRVLKRQWCVLEADMDPEMLTSRLPYIPLKYCTIFEGTRSTDVQQRIKNAETLLSFLLHREEEDWPKDLIDGLQETDQRPLAQTLHEEYQKVMKEEKGEEEELWEQMTTKLQDASRLPAGVADV